MAKKDRTGNRKTREERKTLNPRMPELGYYLIVTDTKETEKNYFEGLYQSLPDNLRGNRIVIKVRKTETSNLVNTCLELIASEPQYRMLWIIFDRDQVSDFDDIIADATRNGFKVGWSNPCFEIWMYAYYGSMPNIQESRKCCNQFSELYKTKTGQDYEKADKELYRKISATGDEDGAFEIAKQKLIEAKRNGHEKPSEMVPSTTVHILVSEIKQKIQKD